MVRHNLEAERGRLGLTKAELCRRIGVTTKTYNTYLNGAPISSKILETLAELTGKTMEYLLDRDES